MTVLPISQYSFPNGSSACTAISSMVLGEFLYRLDVGEVDESMHDPSKLCGYLIESVNEYQKFKDFSKLNSDHLSVDEFFTSTEHLWTKLNKIGGFHQANLQDSFVYRNLINSIIPSCDSKKHIGIILTKPPETIFIILSPSSGPSKHYYLFDSHSRPQLGIEGAYLYSSEHLPDIVKRLEIIFPTLEMHSGESLDNLMYNFIEATVFQSFEPSKSLHDEIYPNL